LVLARTLLPKGCMAAVKRWQLLVLSAVTTSGCFDAPLESTPVRPAPETGDTDQGSRIEIPPGLAEKVAEKKPVFDDDPVPLPPEAPADDGKRETEWFTYRRGALEALAEYYLALQRGNEGFIRVANSPDASEFRLSKPVDLPLPLSRQFVTFLGAWIRRLPDNGTVRVPKGLDKVEGDYVLDRNLPLAHVCMKLGQTHPRDKPFKPTDEIELPWIEVQFRLSELPPDIRRMVEPLAKGLVLDEDQVSTIRFGLRQPIIVE